MCSASKVLRLVREREVEVKVGEMEESLIEKGIEEISERVITWQRWREEVKRICYIGGPVIPVLSSQFILNIISIMMAGHLDKLSLSSTALAISIAGVTGFSFLVSFFPYHNLHLTLDFILTFVHACLILIGFISLFHYIYS